MPIPSETPHATSRSSSQTNLTSAAPPTDTLLDCNLLAPIPIAFQVSAVVNGSQSQEAELAGRSAAALAAQARTSSGLLLQLRNDRRCSRDFLNCRGSDRSGHLVLGGGSLGDRGRGRLGLGASMSRVGGARCGRKAQELR